MKSFAQMLVESRGKELPPIVQDYINHLIKIRDAKSVDAKIKNRKRAVRALEIMTTKTADIAVAEAKRLGLSKYAVGMD